nr:hypothetical protein RVX_3303 [Nitratidesulfovibrio sp. HK-II]
MRPWPCEWGRERQRKLKALRTAFKTGDTMRALSIARELCGIEEKEVTEQ